jgi:hypothetical protein
VTLPCRHMMSLQLKAATFSFSSSYLGSVPRSYVKKCIFAYSVTFFDFSSFFDSLRDKLGFSSSVTSSFRHVNKIIKTIFTFVST